MVLTTYILQPGIVNLTYRDVRLIEFSITIIGLIESKSFRLSHNRISRLIEIFDYPAARRTFYLILTRILSVY